MSSSKAMTANETMVNAQQTVAERFLTTLAARDWVALQQLFSPGARWTMPGSGTISGLAEGSEALVARCQQIVGYGVQVELQRVLFGQAGFALSLHNTAARNAVKLNEYLATVCQLQDGLIVAIDTYISDVAGFNAFFND